ncbi:DUF1295-domain-containing protein [Backusella circina FSU 941]|nr:DUF1295-domain-containing protein [Backusella circina FSU 941]
MSSGEVFSQKIAEVLPEFPAYATWEYTRNNLQISFDTFFQDISADLLRNPVLLLEYYKNTDPLFIAFCTCTTFVCVHYITSEITKNYSQVDRAWSLLPILYSWHFTIHDYLVNNSLQPRLLVASVLISIWGSRLTYNFARKGGYYLSGHDYRFPYLRNALGGPLMALLNLVFIAPFQNYLLLLMVSPIYLASSISPRNLSLNTIDWTAIVLHLSLLFFEVVADEQQYVFQTQKYALLDYLKPSELKGDYKLGFLWHSGLFQYSRHPNFFAEISMWWVIYLFSVASVHQTGLSITSSLLNWTLMGPIVLTNLFQGSTWLTEVRA